MAYETIIYQKEEGIGIITLNRPHRKNAINSQLLDEMRQALDEIAGDDEVRVVIITGAEGAFSAGADIRERMPPDYLRRFRDLLRAIETGGKPVIAAVNGLALGGGCEISLACDLTIASQSATMGVPEIKIGAIPSAGGTQRLPRLIGAARAKELLFFGNPINSNEAYRVGLVNKVVPDENFMDEVKNIARVLLDRPPVALRMAKSAVNTGIKIDLESGLDFEANCAAILSTTEDSKEGIRAFAEKRKPVWKGR